MNRNFDFDFSKLKNRRDLKRIYNSEIWNWFNKNKDCVFPVFELYTIPIIKYTLS